jgi:hypothetical protein
VQSLARDGAGETFGDAGPVCTRAGHFLKASGAQPKRSVSRPK